MWHRFAAVEDLFHQALDEYGNPIRTETRKLQLRGFDLRTAARNPFGGRISRRQAPLHGIPTRSPAPVS